MGTPPRAGPAVVICALLATCAAPLQATPAPPPGTTPPSALAKGGLLATEFLEVESTAPAAPEEATAHATGSATSSLATVTHPLAPGVPSGTETPAVTTRARALALMTSSAGALEATTGQQAVLKATVSLQATLETTTGHHSTSATAPAQRPDSRTSVGHSPTSETTVGHQPASKSTVGHQPASKSTVGHQPASKTTVGHQPASTTTVGHQPASKTTVGHQPALTTTVGHQPASTTTSHYLISEATTSRRRVLKTTVASYEPAAPQARSWRWPVLVAVTVAVLVVLALLVAAWLYCRRHRSGSTSFGPWAGPAPLPEDDGWGGGGPVNQPLVASGQEAATLSTFQATRDSVAMEELPGPQGEPPANGDAGIPATSPPLPEITAGASC